MTCPNCGYCPECGRGGHGHHRPFTGPYWSVEPERTTIGTSHTHSTNLKQDIMTEMESLVDEARDNDVEDFLETLEQKQDIDGASI